MLKVANPLSGRSNPISDIHCISYSSNRPFQGSHESDTARNWRAACENVTRN